MLSDAVALPAEGSIDDPGTSVSPGALSLVTVSTIVPVAAEHPDVFLHLPLPSLRPSVVGLVVAPVVPGSWFVPGLLLVVPLLLLLAAPGGGVGVATEEVGVGDPFGREDLPGLLQSLLVGQRGSAGGAGGGVHGENVVDELLHHLQLFTLTL